MDRPKKLLIETFVTYSSNFYDKNLKKSKIDQKVKYTFDSLVLRIEMILF